MAVKKDKKSLKVNYLIIFLGGFVLLITSVLVFLLVVKNVYGNYEIEEILPTKENLESIAYKEKAAILYSQYTENMLPEGSTWLSDNIDTWETFFKSIKMDYDLISDQTIELGRHYAYKLLILPGSKSMSDRELIQLKKYLENGGSVFCTSGVATFSDEAKWRGWDFFTEVFGMKFTKEIDPEEDKYKVHTLRGALPITAGIPTGYALRIATWDRPIYAEILEPRTTQVSFWYDFRRATTFEKSVDERWYGFEGLVREEVQKSAGIAYGNYGKGRFVWYGFELNSVIGKQEDYIYFEKLFKNSINWLTYRPTGYIKDWPAPYEAAFIYVPTVTNMVGNVRNIGYVSDSIGVASNIVVDPFAAAENPGTIKSISNYGEFSAAVDIGFLVSAQDTINKLYGKETQYSNIAFAADTLRKITGKPLKGISPLYGFYDDNTLQVMSQMNIDYLLTDSLTDRSVPKVVVRNNKQMLVITKTARDDYEVVRDYRLKEPKFQKYTYEEDVDRVVFEGGLYVFKVHTDYQLRPEYAGVIRDVINYGRSKNMWVTSLSNLKKWWLRRGAVEVRYDTRSKRRIAVEVSNPTDKVITDFVVEINLNKPVKDIEISSEIITTKIPRYEFDPVTYNLKLYLETLDPGETKTYLVDFDNMLPL